MCICCPPAISALFCLWCQSGCSKGSVAGALTFFPPEPPLYSFEKRDVDGNLVVDDDDDDDGDNDTDDQYDHNDREDFSEERVNPNEPDERQKSRRSGDDDSTDDEQNGLVEGGSSRDKKRKGKGKVTSQSGGSKESKEKMKSPAQQLVDKNQSLRKRAKRRNLRDARDHELGIKYNLVLDPRLAIPPYDERNVTCVKIPSWNGIHIATIIYKCPSYNDDMDTSTGVSVGPSASVDSASAAGCGAEFLDFTDSLKSNTDVDGAPSSPASSTKITARAAKVKSRDGNRTPKTIIYSHGNATDIGAMFPLQAILAHSLDCNIVMYDYSGYGESGGIPLEENTYKDIEAVYSYVLEHYADNDPENIILYGQSVGSGPCCKLASSNFIKNNQKNNKDSTSDNSKRSKTLSRVGGLILHSPFTSGMRVLTPSRLLACLDIYPNIDRIKKVKCPVMIIHGRLDEEVEIDHGIQLHNAVASQYQRDPWWVPDRGHNDITEGPGKLAEYVRRLRHYLRSL